MRLNSGHRWEAFKRQVFACYGDVCWICGCGGARQVDHVEPVTEDGRRMLDLANCRPAHGAPGNPCPACSELCKRKVHCNQLRGAMSPERARRIIAEWADAAKQGEAPAQRATGYTAGQHAGGRTGKPDEGRAW